MDEEMSGIKMHDVKSTKINKKLKKGKKEITHLDSENKPRALTTTKQI